MSGRVVDISKVCGIGKVVRTVEGFWAEWMSGGGVHCPNTGPHFTLYSVYSTDALLYTE